MLVVRRLALLVSALVAATLLNGCAIGSLGPDPSPRAGLDCVDDSDVCVRQRGAALRSLMADKSNKWVREPATPAAHASGVRLFAYRGKRRELSCGDLHHGKREAEQAATGLRRSGGGLTPAQISRASMLGAEVARELAGEIRRRCRGARR
ncbi:MAG: hypothetical protein AB7E70_11120 [Hyphomicrobiaceae bacterium]